MRTPRTTTPLARPWLLLLSLVAVAGCASDPFPPIDYPEAARGDHVDVYHGEEVADPYRWLEDLESPETAAWVEAQNAIAEPILAGLPRHDEISQRLTELWNFERYGVPLRRGGRYFYTRNNGLQDQDVLLTAGDLQAEPRTLIDPNAFSEDATVALAGYSVSPEATYLAYATSDGGTDWNAWMIRNVETGQDLDDRLEHTKFTSTSWLPDESGFYYSRYPARPDGTGDGQAQTSVYFHRVGTAQAEDRQVFSVTDHPRRNPYGEVSDDGRYLILNITEGTLANGVYYRDLRRPGRTVRLLDDWDARYDFIGNDGPTFYFHTNLDASRWRVIAIDIRRPARANWREIIPERTETLRGASRVGGHLIAQYLQDARTEVSVFTAAGEPVRDVDLPGIGSAFGFGGEPDHPETFYAYSSFTQPTQIYRYDVETGESSLFRESEVDAEIDAYETRQVFYESRDGTRVPMFVSHRTGLDLTGDHPTLLYGYGGFNISLTPSFSTSRLVWMEMGGVLAIPNLRGGGEYGEEWHQAGTKLNKQNVFDDFIAAAEWLIDNGYTSPDRLAIQGGSNGGLLVGAVMTQRPELFGAALPAVGVLDMLRYHTPSLNARAWSSDYGTSEDPDEFAALRAYSPLHNVEEGTCHPPTLINTADRDDRVVPWHSFKFGAALQHAQGCDNPILVRVETRAGHGAGKPTWMRIEETADQWAFLAAALNID